MHFLSCRLTDPLWLQQLQSQLTAPGYVYDPGLRDQNAIVYMLKKDWHKHKAHVLAINKQYCLNCYWRDLLELGDLRSDDSKVRPAILMLRHMHFPGSARLHMRSYR